MSDGIGDIKNISSEPIDNELYQGMYDSVIQLIALEVAHGSLDIDNDSVKNTISRALSDLSKDLLKEESDPEA